VKSEEEKEEKKEKRQKREASKSKEDRRKKQEKNKNKQLLFKEKPKKYGQGLHCKSFNSNVEKVCDLGNKNLECSYCKAMGFNCENKGTLSNPHFGRTCCNKGHIILKQFPVLPQKLLDLLNNNDVLSQYYQKHIRKFNSAMAMASFQAPHEVKPRGEPSSFKIQGQVYRRMGCI
jgi:ATPase subunit of ABC transporter with duplicated ATPase domains